MPLNINIRDLRHLDLTQYRRLESVNLGNLENREQNRTFSFCLDKEMFLFDISPIIFYFDDT